MNEPILDRIVKLFRERGDDMYGGEAVTQTEHALQAAWAAEQGGAPSPLIAAALLHDLGHLMHNLPEGCADHGIDDRHEELGARWLVKYFPPEVVEPVRLHVPAKRFLCHTEPAYFASLSPASVQSLRLQGGPMSEDEAQGFLAHPHSGSAVSLRRWDEEAKVVGLKTPPLEHFLPHVRAALREPTS